MMMSKSNAIRRIRDLVLTVPVLALAVLALLLHMSILPEESCRDAHK
jgi:hypothetical protein